MKLWIAIFIACLLFPSLSCAQSTTTARVSPFTPPNVVIACGTDGTAAMIAAIAASTTNNGMIFPPACPHSNPIYISQTIDINSYTSIICPAAGTWFEWATNTASTSYGGVAGPMFENEGNANGAGASNIQLDQSIAVVNCRFDGNGANQATKGVKEKLLWLVGVNDLTVSDNQFWNGPWDALYIDGNGADVYPTLVTGNYVNTTYFLGGGAGQGIVVAHEQRYAIVSDNSTFNTAGNGFNVDASQNSYSNNRAAGAGFGFTCSNSGITTVYNPGGGGTSQSNWNPCPSGVMIRNVTDETLTGFDASNNYYYGILVFGLKHSTATSWTANNNSLSTCSGTPTTCTGTWNDIQFDLTNVLNTGYGENSDITISDMHVGANPQTSGASNMSIPTAGYGLYFADGITGAYDEATIATAGSGYSGNGIATFSGGTSTYAAQVKITGRTGTVPNTLSRTGTTSAGANGEYTVLPSNPVSTTGGGGTGLTLTVSWTHGKLINIDCGLTVTSCTRYPSFTGAAGNWTFGP